jgi:hypothetical protein
MSRVLVMGYSNQLPVESGGILNILLNNVGVPGFLIGTGLYCKSRQAPRELGERGHRLTETLFPIAHLRKLAKDLEQHSAIV